MTIMGKVGSLWVAALVVIAMTAAPASAATDFPHEESASAWTAIEAYDWNGDVKYALGCDEGAAGSADCGFSGSSSTVGMVLFGILGWGGTASISGDLGEDGEIVITKSSGMPSSGSYSGSICRHTETQEYWVRVADSNGSSVMFGHLGVDNSGLPSSTPTHFPRALEFGDTEDRILTAATGWIPFYAADFGGMWDEEEVLIGQADGASACGWPEIS